MSQPSTVNASCLSTPSSSVASKGAPPLAITDTIPARRESGPKAKQHFDSSQNVSKTPNEDEELSVESDRKVSNAEVTRQPSTSSMDEDDAEISDVPNEDESRELKSSKTKEDRLAFLAAMAMTELQNGGRQNPGDDASRVATSQCEVGPSRGRGESTLESKRRRDQAFDHVTKRLKSSSMDEEEVRMIEHSASNMSVESRNPSPVAAKGPVAPPHPLQFEGSHPMQYEQLSPHYAHRPPRYPFHSHCYPSPTKGTPYDVPYSHPARTYYRGSPLPTMNPLASSPERRSSFPRHYEHDHEYRGAPPPSRAYGHPVPLSSPASSSMLSWSSSSPPRTYHGPGGAYHGPGGGPAPVPIPPNHHPDYYSAAPYDSLLRHSGGLPKSLSFRKICSKCGKPRSEHGDLGFGNRCAFQECGKCGASVERHLRYRSPMGVLCHLTVRQGAVPGAATEYRRKLAELAARADLQKERKQQHHQHQQGSGESSASESNALTS